MGFAPEACGVRPLKARCTPARARQVTFHAYEVELRAARGYQRTAALQARYRLWPCIERIVRLLERHGALKARYFPHPKLRFQLLLVAININTKELMASRAPLGSSTPRE